MHGNKYEEHHSHPDREADKTCLPVSIKWVVIVVLVVVVILVFGKMVQNKIIYSNWHRDERAARAKTESVRDQEPSIKGEEICVHKRHYHPHPFEPIFVVSRRSLSDCGDASVPDLRSVLREREKWRSARCCRCGSARALTNPRNSRGTSRAGSSLGVKRYRGSHRT